MSERVCQTCGAPIIEQRRTRRKFCSRRCRQAQYAGTCIDCGAPTNGSDGRDKAPVRCRECDKKLISGRAQARFKGKNDRIAELYLAGVPLKDMAAEMGLTPHALRVAVQRLRHNYGYDLPYRYNRREDRAA